uniref:Uncharacterized protein n=1 Tax=Ralstonia syzygii R24 TaxID=907261 RepID=G3A722_9RALS|nr:hypothetical protein RALSY_40497 [Ralstonia syzygii R24]
MPWLAVSVAVRQMMLNAVRWHDNGSRTLCTDKHIADFPLALFAIYASDHPGQRHYCNFLQSIATCRHIENPATRALQMKFLNLRYYKLLT